MSEIVETKILRHCVTNTGGMSYLQERILNDPKPVRIFSAPTGAGKSYAFQKAVTENNMRVLFIVPTRRLAQNLANSLNSELLEHDPDLKMNEKLAIWTSDEGKRIKQENPQIKLSTLRVRELLGLEQVETGDMIIATPETVAMILLKPRISPGTPQVTITEFITHFDHIVFDEFHTIEARGFGLAANFALVSSKLNTQCKVTFLSATPIDITAVLTRLGVNENSISIDCEKITTGEKKETGNARAVHGDVTVKFYSKGSMCDLLEIERETLQACLDAQRQVVVIFDSLKNLMLSREKIISSLAPLGINPEDCLAINSIDDGIIKADGEKTIEDPLKFRVLLCTSSVEMGVTFKAGAIFMDPGFNSLSFIQRMGRVARGDETGHVIVCCDESLNRKNWLRDAILSLKDCEKIDILDFVKIFTKGAVKKFQLEKTDNFDHFGTMSNRAIFCSALFWYIMKNTWIARKKGHRIALKKFEPNQVKVIAKLISDLKRFNLKSVKKWLEAYEEEATNLRSIGQTVIVRDTNNTTRPVPYNLYVSNSYLISCDVYFDDKSGEQIVYLDRTFDEISTNFNIKCINNQRSAMVPYSTTTIPVMSHKTFKNWVSTVSNFVEDIRNDGSLIEAAQIAKKLVVMTGIIPIVKDIEVQ